MSNSSDEDLMLAYQGGDAASFDELLARHKKGVYNFLYRHIHQAQVVEEAFQEVFVRVIRAAPNYSPTAKFTTWLYTIARNYCIDHSRQMKLRKPTFWQDKDQNGEKRDPWEERISDENPTPEDMSRAKDISDKLTLALNRINPDQKEVFLLREQSGLPFEEIAQIVGGSVNTVKSRMRYALMNLQEEFKKLGITKPNED